MADYSITITVPLAKDAAFLAALRAQFGQVADGANGERDMTKAEVKARVKQMHIEMLTRIYRDQTRRALETDIDIT